jgi:hypothetical protein
MIKYGKPVTFLLTIATSSTISAACDLGIPCEYVSIVLPTLDSTTIAFQVSHDGVTYQALGIGTSAVSAATTGAVTETFLLGGYQFFKIVCGTAQSSAPATRTFEARGYRG